MCLPRCKTNKALSARVLTAPHNKPMQARKAATHQAAPQKRPPRHSHRLHTRGSQHNGKGQGKLATSTQPQPASVHTCCLYWCYKCTALVFTPQRCEDVRGPSTRGRLPCQRISTHRDNARSFRGGVGVSEHQSSDTTGATVVRHREHYVPSQPGDVCVHSRCLPESKTLQCSALPITSPQCTPLSCAWLRRVQAVMYMITTP